MSLIGTIIAIYVWTLLVLLSEEVDSSFKKKSFGEKVLYITILFGIVIAGIVLF